MTAVRSSRARAWAGGLARRKELVARVSPLPVEGRLTRMIGLTLEATGCMAAVGDRCEIRTTEGAAVEAEVVGFGADRLYLMPTGDLQGLRSGARVVPRTRAGQAAVLGRPIFRERNMADLQASFEAAVAASKTLGERPDNQTLLQLYALYKQATAGDAEGKRPGFGDMVGRVAMQAPCDVLLVPRAAAAWSRGVLAVVDDAATAAAVASAAARIASHDRLPLWLAGIAGHAGPDAETRAMQAAGEAGVQARRTAPPAGAAEAIGGIAAASGADLIVVGRHGHRGALERLMPGSGVEKVIGHADCAVLVARNG